MANTLSAAKRARQAIKRNVRNRALKTKFKSLRRKVLAAVESGNSKEAEEQFRLYASAIDKAAKAKLIHKNSASGHKSRVARRLAVRA